MARKAGLRREDVLDEAVTIANRDGLEQLTVTRLAAELGIRPPSLYAHVDGLDALRDEVARRGASTLAAALRDAAGPTSGGEALHAFAHAIRRFAREHPGMYEALVRAPGADDVLAAPLREPVDVVVSVLADLDIHGDEALHATRALRAAAHGFIDLERRGGFGLPLDLDASFDRLVDALVSGLALSPPGSGR